MAKFGEEGSLIHAAESLASVARALEVTTKAAAAPPPTTPISPESQRAAAESLTLAAQLVQQAAAASLQASTPLSQAAHDMVAAAAAAVGEALTVPHSLEAAVAAVRAAGIATSALGSNTFGSQPTPPAPMGPWEQGKLSQVPNLQQTAGVPAADLELSAIPTAIREAIERGNATARQADAAEKREDADRQKAQAREQAKSGAGAVGVDKGGVDSLLGAVTQLKNQFLAIASSAAPLAFRTLTGHVTLLSMAVGQFLEPALAGVSVATFQLTNWLKGLDESTQQTITSTITWSIGIGTTILAANRLVAVAGLLGKTLGGLGLLNPFGALAAGVAAIAIQGGQLGTLLAVGEQLGSALLPVFQAVSGAAIGLAESLSGPVIGAMQILAGTIQVVVGAVSTVGRALGGTSETFGGMIVIVGLFSRQLWALGAALEGSAIAMRITRALTADLTGVMGLSAAAARGLSVALVTTGVGAIVIAVTAATSALLTMGGAFRGVGDMVAEADKKIRELQATLDKLAGGGKLKEDDLKQALTPAEYRKFVDATNPEAREKVLKEAKARNDREVEGGKNPEVGRRAAAHIEEALNQKIDAPNDTMLENSYDIAAEKRLEQIKKTLVESGLSNKQAEEMTGKISKQFDPGWFGSRKLGGEHEAGGALDQDTIKGIMAMIKADMGEAAAKSQIIAEALKNGVGPTRLGMLQSIKAQFPYAFHKEVQAQQVDFGGMRALLQNQNLNKDPLELEILQATRDEAIKHTAAATAAVNKLNDLLKLMGG